MIFLAGEGVVGGEERLQWWAWDGNLNLEFRDAIREKKLEGVEVAPKFSKHGPNFRPGFSKVNILYRIHILPLNTSPFPPPPPTPSKNKKEQKQKTKASISSAATTNAYQ